MQRVNVIIEEIQKTKKISIEDIPVLESLLTHSIEKTGTQGITLNDERLLAMGAHLVAVIERARQRESLPEVDVEMLDQVEKELRDLSKEILESHEIVKPISSDLMEGFLLSVHLATAKYS